MTLSELLFANEIASQLEQAGETLRYTYGRCIDLGDKETLTRDEEERTEALTSKFAGWSDIYAGVRTRDVYRGVLGCTPDLLDAVTRIRGAIARIVEGGAYGHIQA